MTRRGLCSERVIETLERDRWIKRHVCDAGSVMLKEFTATEFTINGDTWQLADKKLTKE